MSKEPNVKCNYCGKAIYKKPSIIKKSKTGNFYCDMNCCEKGRLGKKLKQKGEYIACPICGKIKYYNQARIKRSNDRKICCSVECWDIRKKTLFKGKNNPVWNSRKIKCNYCGKWFYRPESLILTDKLYCTSKCFNKWRSENLIGEKAANWQGGKTERRWNHFYRCTREDVLERDNYTCQVCGSKEKLEFHHIKSYKRFPEYKYKLDNGITLCQKCHMEFHSKYNYFDFTEGDWWDFIDTKLNGSKINETTT